MHERVAYPRTLAVVRVVLYLFAAVVAVGISGVAVSFLGIVLGVSVLTLLLNGDVSVLAMAGLFGFVLLTVGFLLGGLVTGVRRADRSIRSALSSPTPLEQTKQQYVDAEFDESELERRLDTLLDPSPASDGSSPTGRGRLLGRRLLKRADVDSQTQTYEEYEYS